MDLHGSAWIINGYFDARGSTDMPEVLLIHVINMVFKKKTTVILMLHFSLYVKNSEILTTSSFHELI